MRKPSAPRPEPSGRSQGAPVRIPPRRSGTRHVRLAAGSARPGRNGTGQSRDRQTPQGPQSETAPEQPTAAARPNAPGAGASPRTAESAARGASSSGSRPASPKPRRSSSPRGPEASDPTETASSPDRASSTELTVFSRRPVSPLGGGDRVVSTGLADRLRERRQALRRLRLRRLVTAGVAVLAVVVVTWALVFSPLLGLETRRISVVGSDGSVSDAQVRDVLASYEGDSLLRLDTDRLSSRVSDGLVRVRQARVTRAWPRGLRVELTMRVPVATVQGPDGYQVLDNEAVVLERVQEAPSGLVTIMPDSSNGDGATQPQEVSARQVAAVTQVVGSLAPETLAQVTSGSATTAGQVTLALNNGAGVIWGDTRDNALKAQVLATLMAASASVYDVSSPHRPTTRSSDTASSGTPTSAPTS